MTTLLDEGALTAARAWCAGAPVEVHEKLGSTNDRVAELAAAGAPEGTLVIAREQTAGRGRRGRTWASPRGGLYFSFLLRPSPESLQGPPATLVAGLALCQALEGLTPPDARPQLKWPNDVLIRGRKVSGILGEMSLVDGSNCLILGLGINVEAVELPSELREIATHLEEVGATPTRAQVLSAFFLAFGAWHTRLSDAAGRTSLLEEAAVRMPNLGQPIRLRLPNEVVEGVFAGLNPSGGLLLTRADGSQRAYLAGEVESARTA